MVRLIMSGKGSGKTKQLIEMVNVAAKEESGCVICIEPTRNMTYNIHNQVRLIDAEEYKLSSYEVFRGFISGLYAGNYDISHVFVDNVCKTVGRDVDSETVFPGEDRVLIASPKVATYDLQPEMSAYEVCDKCVERIESGAYDVIILNFANCDMVGHTGVCDAAVKAVETGDTCVGRVVDATLKMGGIAMITADHGNSEQMTEADGSPMTAHTTNPVPFILCGAGSELRKDGRLADIAPTILDVLGLACPAEMDGTTLIVK